MKNRACLPCKPTAGLKSSNWNARSKDLWEDCHTASQFKLAQFAIQAYSRAAENICLLQLCITLPVDKNYFTYTRQTLLSTGHTTVQTPGLAKICCLLTLCTRQEGRQSQIIQMSLKQQCSMASNEIHYFSCYIFAFVLIRAWTQILQRQCAYHRQGLCDIGKLCAMLSAPNMAPCKLTYQKLLLLLCKVCSIG